jgi:hypothetical protein
MLLARKIGLPPLAADGAVVVNDYGGQAKELLN